MKKRELILQYCTSVKTWRKQCLDAGINESEFRVMYKESLAELKKYSSRKSNYIYFLDKYKMWLLFITILLITTYYNKVLYKCFLCDVQEYIYPGMRLLRKISLPIISLFPSLTDFYHESCLLQNPFFTVMDMDCWPCSTVINVKEIYDPKPHPQYNAPLLYKTTQERMNIELIKKIYMKNKKIFDVESPYVFKNNIKKEHVHKMFNDNITDTRNTIFWRFNSMNTARILRQFIPRPKIVPKQGQSTERFVIIHNSQDSLRVPDTECNFAFIISLYGNQIVHLIPSEECKNSCKTLKVYLKETYLLWYNWWYWRPVVQSKYDNITFIAYVSSYCTNN